MRTKIGQEGEVNNNLPIDCWNQTTVQLKIESDHDGMTVDGYCYNGSSWKGVASDLADPFIYEEGMNWDVPVSDSCSWAGGSDWNLDGSDACAISTSTDIDGYALTLTNGAATITGSITSATSLLVQNATLRIIGGYINVEGT